jgi:uncharacterized protein (TIGR03435 family)
MANQGDMLQGTLEMPLFVVLATAYQIPFQSREALEQRIKGIPDWMFSAPYDMELITAAPAPPGLSTKARNERIRFMLQAILADRLDRGNDDVRSQGWITRCQA